MDYFFHEEEHTARPTFDRKAWSVLQDVIQWESGLQSDDLLLEVRTKIEMALDTAVGEGKAVLKRWLQVVDEIDRRRAKPGRPSHDQGATDSWPNTMGLNDKDDPQMRDGVSACPTRLEVSFATAEHDVRRARNPSPEPSQQESCPASGTSNARPRQAPVQPLSTQPKAPKSGQLFGDEFGLDSFISMRTGKIPIAPQKPAAPAVQLKRSHRTPVPVIIKTSEDRPKPPASSTGSALTRLLDKPAFASLTCEIVINTTRPTTRTLARSIRALCHHLRILERAPDRPDADDGSDLILSPSAGLLLTTLAHLRQLPLPGTRALPPLHARLLRAAPRYARLVVLVALGPGRSGASSAGGGLTTADCTAVTRLQGFARSAAVKDLGTAVEVVVAARGGETDEGVTRWVGWLIARFGGSSGAEKASEDDQDEDEGDSAEEAWLQRMGLNVLAARAVISKLVNKVEGGNGANLRAALQKLLQMRPAERMARFSDVVGRQVLERVTVSLLAQTGFQSQL